VSWKGKDVTSNAVAQLLLKMNPSANAMDVVLASVTRALQETRPFTLRIVLKMTLSRLSRTSVLSFLTTPEISGTILIVKELIMR
jgi:hypothetical protein